MIEAHAGVEIGHDDAAAAIGDGPRALGVDRRDDARVVDDGRARRRAQVPLPDGRHAAGLSAAVQRVVGHGERVHAAVDDGVFDVSLGRQALRQFARCEPAALDHLGARPEHAAVAQAQPEPCRQRLRVLRPGGRDADRERAHQRRVGLELDDDARLDLERRDPGLAQRAALDAGAGQCGRSAQRHRGQRGQDQATTDGSLHGFSRGCAAIELDAACGRCPTVAKCRTHAIGAAR